MSDLVGYGKPMYAEGGSVSEQEAWTMVNKISKLIEERDALVAERDEAVEMSRQMVAAYELAGEETEAAEAERDRLREALRGKCDCGHIHDRDSGCGDCSCELWTCAALGEEA